MLNHFYVCGKGCDAALVQNQNAFIEKRMLNIQGTKVGRCGRGVTFQTYHCRRRAPSGEGDTRPSFFRTQDEADVWRAQTGVPDEKISRRRIHNREGAIQMAPTNLRYVFGPLQRGAKKFLHV